MNIRPVRAVSDIMRKTATWSKMVSKVKQTTCAATRIGNQIPNMRGLLMDSALSSNDKKFKQTDTAFHKQDIFTFIDFKCPTVSTRVLFLALFVGCMLIAECKTQTVNDTVRHNLDPMTNYVISSNGKNPSLINLEHQSSVLNSPQKQESQLSGVDITRHGSNSTTHNTISDNGKHGSRLNGVNLMGFALENGEQQSSGINSLPSQESQSSKLDTARHESNSKTQNRITNDGTNPTTFNDSSLTHITLVKLEQQTSGLDVSQEQNYQSAGFDTLQNLGTRMKSNQAGARSNYPFAVTPRNSGYRNEYGPKKSDGDLKNCFGKLNKETVQKYFDKLRQYANKKRMKELVDRTKTMSKDIQTKTMRSMSGGLKKVRESNCVQNGRQSMGRKPEQDRPKPNSQYEFRPDQNRPRPDNPFGFPIAARPSVTPTKSHNEGSRGRAKERQSGGWSEFQLECLTAHNEYRTRHGVPSLQLRKDLCESSQKYASYLGSTDPRERMEHSQVGENLSVTGRDVAVSGRSVVTDWYNEIYNYNFQTTYPIDKSQEYAHFTTVVWKEITHLGCGIARGASGAVYVVCHYDPPGNVRLRSDPAREFFKNVLLPLHR